MILLCPELNSVLETEEVQKLYWVKQLVQQKIQGNAGSLLLKYVVKCKATLTSQS